VETRKTVTVLFADVTGSTALGERLDPESMRGVMSRYFDEMRSAIQGHGGSVEKFIGDAVMAVFGVPTVHEDDALRAVRAASQMRDLLDALNAELERDWGAVLEIRTGVNTGEVIAGDPSSGQSFVTGDTVNVAARLEQAAEPGEILIGAVTRELVRDAVQVKETEPLELKGKTEPVAAFRLLDVMPGSPGFARHLDSPLVGREGDLAQLAAAFGEAVGGRMCRVATVVGDAGLGKSRLVTEFVTRNGDRARTLWSRCLPYGEGITFWPVTELVWAAGGIGEVESPEDARAKVRALLAGAEDGDAIAELVEAAIGLSEEGTGADIRQTFWAVRRLLEVLAEDGPLVVVIDDIHWAESTFLDLLQYLSGFSAGHPMFVLCTSRPEIRERRPDWASVSTMVMLAPLTAAECERLIANLLGEAGVSGDAADRIAEAAEGNPLFVEEMLHKLIDDGSLERDGGTWTATRDLSEVSVPGTISALLAARLDQLEPGERAVIQRASVVGKTFWWGAVSELSPEEERARVGAHLQTLLRKELVRPDRSRFAGEDAFRFSHILVRDAAYDSMPKRSRAELHERFAAWLERAAGDRVAEFEEIVGYHLEHAYRYRAELGPVDDAGRALARTAADRLAAAGLRALAHWDIAATDNLLSRAIALLPSEDPLRVELLRDLGVALGQSDLSRADAALGEAMEGSRAAGDLGLEGRAGVRRLFIRLLRETQISQAAALAEAEGYVERFEASNDDDGLAEALGLVGMIHFWQGKAAISELDFERGLRHARAAGDRRQEGELLRRLALVIDQGPAPVEEGIGRVEAIMAEGGGDRRVEIGASRALADLEAMRGNFDEARVHIARAKTLARELGDHVALAAVHRDAGFVEMRAGDPVAHEREARVGYEILDQVGDLGHLASAAPDLGDAVYGQGRYEEALEIAEYSRSITLAGDVDAEVRGLGLLAKTMARLGRLDEAESSAAEAVRLAAPTDYLEVHAIALLSQAEVFLLAGKAADAAAAIRDARELFGRKGDIVGEARAAALGEGLAPDPP
jgi:class 3 adenylate cyclase/tetratricopeptide (TPR) repeat protein